jgi:LacI family transcriptional regulator
MITIKEVAAAAQVSIKTVSRVLNNEVSVSDETRQHVQAVIDRLGYVPNLSARRLKSGKSRSLALVLPLVTSSYAGKLLSCVLAEARCHGYSLLVLEDRMDEPDGLKFIKRTILDRQSDGLLIAPPGADNPQLVEFVRERDVPIVLITPNFSNPSYSSIEVTDRKGGYEATCYLLELGHRRIAHITTLKSERFSQERLGGYLDALREAGVLLDSSLIQEGENTVETGYAAALRLLDQPEPPTAFFAGDDEMAVGAMFAIWQRGLRVPEDISVVGYDDAPIARQVFPALTTVSQTIDEIARVAVNKLVGLIEGHSVETENMPVSTHLIIRDSCAPRVAQDEANVK